MKKRDAVNFRNGEMTFSDVPLSALAREFDTPLYVLSQDVFEERLKKLKATLDKTGTTYRLNYAGKAFLTTGMVKLIEKEGLDLDTVSAGEIFTALAAGFPGERISLHGSNKGLDELYIAIDEGITIIVDSPQELELIKMLAGDREVNVYLRVNPGVHAHTNEMINTGRTDSKFGIDLNEVGKALDFLEENPHLKLNGLHAHVGSQITESAPYIAAGKKLLGLIKEAESLGFNDLELNLGGGFGIAYTEEESEFEVEKELVRIVEALKKEAKALGVDFPRLAFEPGRFLIGPSGVTLYTVGTIKEIPGVRTYVSVDGGLPDNPRPALYGAKYEAAIVNRELTKENLRKVRLSGKTCETDTLIDEVALAEPQMGDILAVFDTGAYNHSMASHYNRLLVPPVVLIHQGNVDSLSAEEEYTDLIRKDKIPFWLR